MSFTIARSRLTNILAVLNRQEWRGFRRFIQASLAGPAGKSLELYDYLSGSYPDFTGPALIKATIFKSLFGDASYDDKKLRYVLTDLYRYTCSFLKFNALEAYREEGNYLLAATLASRGADKAYLAHYTEDGVNSSSDADGNAENYFVRYRKEFVHLNHFIPRQKRSDKNPIASVAKNLDIFFIAKKLQLLCEIINVTNVMAVQHDFMLEEKIIELVKQGVFNEIPVIVIYYRIYMTLTQPDDETHFDILKLLLSGNEKKFQKAELRDMYQYLMNYCIKKINQGAVRFVSVLSGIYKIILENKVIYNGEYLSQWDFKNMVVIGLRAGEMEWVLHFITHYKNALAIGEQENAYKYNLAYYYFVTADYRQALSLLNKVEFTDLYYQLDMRALLLKCYFEMDDQEAYFYHIAAFRIFLSRNKVVSDYQRTLYRNMIKYTTRLIRAAGKLPKIEQLQKEINEVKQIADLTWLNRKTEVAVLEN